MQNEFSSFIAENARIGNLKEQFENYLIARKKDLPVINKQCAEEIIAGINLFFELNSKPENIWLDKVKMAYEFKRMLRVVEEDFGLLGQYMREPFNKVKKLVDNWEKQGILLHPKDYLIHMRVFDVGNGMFAYNFLKGVISPS